MDKPILYDTLKFLYNSVMNYALDAIKKNDCGSAFVLYSVGSYGTVKGIQWASKNIINKIIPDFNEKYFSALERICTAIVIQAPVAYLIIDYEGAKTLMTHEPTYICEMSGIYFGSVCAALEDIHKHFEKKTIKYSGKIKEPV